MKKKELKETKAGLKSTGKFKITGANKPKKNIPSDIIIDSPFDKKVKPKKAVKKGRGGYRERSGRKSTKGEFQQIHVDMPLNLIEDMNRAGVKNKTAYIIKLINEDLTRLAFQCQIERVFIEGKIDPFLLK